MPRKIEVSHRTIIFTVLFLISLWFLYQLRDIIFTLFIAFILMSALNPSIERLEKIKISRPLAIVFFYIAFFGLVSVVFAGVVPPLVDQTATLLESIPGYIEEINLPWVDKAAILTQLSKLAAIPETLVKLTVNVFRNLMGIIFLALITYYFLMERKNLGKYLVVLFSGDGQERANQFILRIEKRLGRWVRAQIFLMILIGVVSYVGLRLLGIDYALPLAVFAGLLEIVPNIGPTVASIPAIISGLTISPLYGAAVAALYLLIQQLENSLIVPKVMAKGLDINPLVVIVSLIVGLKLGGVLGMFMALPVFLVLREIASEVGASNYFPKA